MDQRLNFFSSMSLPFAPEMSCFDPALISMQNQIDTSLLYPTTPTMCFDTNPLPYPYMDHSTLEELFNDTQFQTLPPQPASSVISNPIFISNPPLPWGIYNPSIFPNHYMPAPSKSKSKGKRRSSTSQLYSYSTVHTCPYASCQRGFKRPEHLKRHINSLHSSEKPFQCNQPNCARRFSRSDNLNQHLKVHQEKPTSSAQRKHSAAF